MLRWRDYGLFNVCSLYHDLDRPDWGDYVDRLFVALFTAKEVSSKTDPDHGSCDFRQPSSFDLGAI